ncbi:MAG: hypothetical protein ACREK4_00095 [Candidatus Rokuibacteriota bacterium]
MLEAAPAAVRADATALILFLGQPNLALAWGVVGSGSILSASIATDAQGRGYAVYTPGTVGDVVTITVSYGS